jgi:hypothetical protein
MTIMEVAHADLVVVLDGDQGPSGRSRTIQSPVYLHTDGSMWRLELLRRSDGTVDLYMRLLSLPAHTRAVTLQTVTLSCLEEPVVCNTKLSPTNARSPQWVCIVEHLPLPLRTHSIEATLVTHDMLRTDCLTWFSGPDVQSAWDRFPGGVALPSDLYMDECKIHWRLEIYPSGKTQSLPADDMEMCLRLYAIPKHIEGVLLTACLRLSSADPDKRTTIGVLEFPQSEWMGRGGRLTSLGIRCEKRPVFNRTKGFHIDCTLEVKDMIRTDRLFLTVNSLATLRQTVPRLHTINSYRFLSPEGIQWILTLYPNGNSEAKRGAMSLFVQPIVLPEGVLAVAFTAAINVVSTSLKRAFKTKELRVGNASSFPASPHLPPRGYTCFAHHKDLPWDAFTITTDIKIQGLLRSDTLMMDVKHYREQCLMQDGPKGTPLRSGTCYFDPTTQATLTLDFYPLGRDMCGHPFIVIRVVHSPPGTRVYIKEARTEIHTESATWGAEGAMTFLDFPEPVADWGWFIWVDDTRVIGPRTGSALAPHGGPTGPLPDTFAVHIHLITSPVPLVKPEPEASEPTEEVPGPTEEVPEPTEEVLDLDAEAPRSYICVISHTLMKDPVMAMDHYTYEREAIEAWIAKAVDTKTQLRSPMTNLPMTDALLPNLAIKSSIADFIEMKMKKQR